MVVEYGHMFLPCKETMQDYDLPFDLYTNHKQQMPHDPKQNTKDNSAQK